METLSPNSAILDKTRELCSLILQSSEYGDNVEKIETFFNSEEAQTTYRDFAQLGEEMQQKQQAGALTQQDVETYEQRLQELKADPVTAGFMEAEEAFNGMVQQIAQHVGKTLELGRLPEPEDFDSDCCNEGGCGCN